MRRIGLPLLLGLATILGGCLEVESEARIARNGQGTFSETVTVDLEALREARLTFRRLTSVIRADPDARPPFWRFDAEQRLAELRDQEGLADVTSTRPTSPEGTRRHVLAGRFTDLEAYFTLGPVDDIAAALWRVDGGAAWRLDARSLYDDEQVDRANRRTLLTFRKRLLAPFRSACKDLRIRRVLVFPTRVRESNGSIGPDGRTVSWTLGFDDIADPANLRQWAVFEHAPDLELEPFGDPPPASEPIRAAAPPDDKPVPAGSAETRAPKGPGK